IIRLYGPGGVSAHINGSTAPIDPGDWVKPGDDAEAAAPQPDEIDVVLDWARRAAIRVGELDNDDERIAALTAEEAELAAHVTELAGRLTQLRTEAGERVAAGLTAGRTALANPHARIPALP